MDPSRGEPATSWEPVFSRAGLGQAVRPTKDLVPPSPEEGYTLDTAVRDVPVASSGSGTARKDAASDNAEVPSETVRMPIGEVDDASSWSEEDIDMG